MNDRQVRKVLDSMGGPNRVAKELRQFSRDSRLLSAVLKNLRTSLPNRWVAVFNGEVVETDKSLTRLLKKVEALGLDPGRVAIRFLEHPRRFHILAAA